MHALISFVVYANTEEEALYKVKSRLNEMCGESFEPFDYYTLFDNPGSEVTGKGRWGNYPATAQVEEIEGEEEFDEIMEKDKEKLMDGWVIIKELVEAMKNELFRSLNEVREHLKYYDNEDFWKGGCVDEEVGEGGLDTDMVRFYCHQIGEYYGSRIFLYSGEGEGLRTKYDLLNVLTKWKNTPIDREKFKDKNIYVVPADVHF